MVISTGETPRVIFDVFTKDKYFRVSGGVTGEIVTGTPVVGTAVEVLSEADNVLHEIPIIEYQYENNRMGSFEAVIPCWTRSIIYSQTAWTASNSLYSP